MIKTDLTNKDYHADKSYLSSSNIKELLISPRFYYYKNFVEKEKPSTPALAFGTMYHSYMESYINTGSEDLFLSQYCDISENSSFRNPKTGEIYGSSTKLFTEACTAANINPDNIITAEKLKQLREMKAVIWDCMELRVILHGSQAELSLIMQDFNGVPAKSRFDIFKKTDKVIFIGDWKTCSQGVPIEEEAKKQIAEYKYHISAAWYADMCQQYFDLPVEFFWVFQEKEPPYDFDFYFASENQISTGETEYKQAIEMFKWCKKEGKWLGYNDIYSPYFQTRKQNKYIDLPVWYMSKLKSTRYPIMDMIAETKETNNNNQ